MSKYFVAVWMILLLVLSSRAISQSRRPLVGKVPAWVTVIPVNYQDTHLDNGAEDGSVDVLFDQQVFPAMQSSYYHKIIRILNESGIQNTSEVTVNFDPSYEQLIFHQIIIRRGSEVIDQLKLSRIKTIQQEKDLHRYMYDGSLSSILFLEDVRKGDVIEFSYTLKGFNPIFNGKYAAMYSLGFSVPVYNLYYKLLSDTARHTIFRAMNTSITPQTSGSGSQLVYEWKLTDIRPFHLQDGVPSWYDPYPLVQVSEYASWKEVNQWANGLFPVINKPMPGIQKKVADIRAQFAKADDQILAALHFVQDDVRYMGIEMGIHSHQPGQPDKIFAQRFGDCKDKSYLLCTMLHQLGIEASPVLINTSTKKLVADFLPAADLFDHATVRVKNGDRIFWFDPTISLQRGKIEDITYPDYQCGLVVTDSTSMLTTIPNNEKGIINVKETFNIDDMSGRATLLVSTAYSGSFADNIRNDFSTTSNYEMLKGFKDYYTPYYEHLTADSLQYTDNESTGVFTTREYYQISDLWELKDNVKKAIFEPYVINGIIRTPKETNRTMPFALNFPAHYQESIEINVPEEWEAGESSHKIETPECLLTSHFSYRDRKFLLLYEYKSTTNAVLPGEMATFIKAVKRKDDETGYSLTKSMTVDLSSPSGSKSTSGEKTVGNVFAVVFFLFFIGLVVYKMRRT